MQEKESEEIIPLVDYPVEIRGSLRIVLQIKDVFIAAFNTLEEYRRCLLACQRGFYRGLAVYNLTVGLNGIKQLRVELDEVERRVQAKVTQNKVLRHYLKKQYVSGESINKPDGIRAVEFLTGIHIPSKKLKRKDGIFRDCNTVESFIPETGAVDAALHGGLDLSTTGVNIDNLKVPPEVHLGSAKTKTGQILLPVVEFYRGFFFLQMHFQITMCLAANYTMPFITQPVGLCKRVRGWPEEPSYPGKAGNTGDRLRDINTELSNLLKRLEACVELVQKKIVQDAVIETYYRQHLAAQEKASRKLLHCIQSQRRYGEDLDGQNDRLTGLATKLDRNFPKIAKFHEFTGPEGIFELVDSFTKSDSPELSTQTQSETNINSGESSKLILERVNSKSSMTLPESVSRSQRIHGDSTFATEAIPLSESVNQLLLGSESVAPGISPQEQIKLEPVKIDDKEKKRAIEEDKILPKESVKVPVKTTEEISETKENNQAESVKREALTDEPIPTQEPTKTPSQPAPSETPSPTKEVTDDVKGQTEAAESEKDKPAVPEISVQEAEQQENVSEKNQETTKNDTLEQNKDENQSANSNYSDYEEKTSSHQLVIGSKNKLTLNAKRKSDRRNAPRTSSRSPSSKSPQPTGKRRTRKEKSNKFPGGSDQNKSNVDQSRSPSSSSIEKFQQFESLNELSVFTENCKLPDINDNNNNQIAFRSESRGLVMRNGRQVNDTRTGLYPRKNIIMNESSNSRNNAREARWRVEDDRNANRQKNVNIVSDVNCVPQWIKVAINKSPHEMSEEELCCDHQRGWTSKATLEKRQVLIEKILKSDGDRLQRMLATILKF